MIMGEECVNYTNSGIIYHIGDGHYYRIKSRKYSKCHLTCATSRHCGGRAVMPEDPAMRFKESFCFSRPHTHPPDTNWIKVQRIRRRMLERCRNEATPFAQIVKEEMEGVDPDVKLRVSNLLDSISRTMKRRRKCTESFIPSDLLQYGEFLKTNQRFGHSPSNKPFYKATLVDDGGNATVIFISTSLSDILPETSHVLVDAAFRVVPSSPACHHLLVIAPVYESLVLPTIFALMSQKTEILYELVFTLVKQTFPQWSPALFTTDYDRVLQNAVRHAWPAAEVVGTWRHSANCMNVKANQLGHSELLWTNKYANRVLKRCQALPFLPPEKIQEGYDHIVEYANSTGMLPILDDFLNYVHRVWLTGVGVKSFSVYRQKKRTQIDMEMYHRKLREHFNQLPPTIWVFTDGVRSMEKDAVGTLEVLKGRLSKGIVPHPASKTILSNMTIRSLTSSLVQNTVGVGDFLEGAGQQLESICSKVYNVLDDYASDDENLEGLVASWLTPDVEDPMNRRHKRRHKKLSWIQESESTNSTDENHG